MQTEGKTPRVRDVSIIGTVSLLMNAALFTFIGVSRPAYLQQYNTNSNPDAHHYVLLGENFWSKGVYSRESGPPYRPDINRTPVYPLLAGGIQVVFEAIWPLYALQCAFGLATAVFVYLIGIKLYGRTLGLWAALLYALDPMMAILNFEAMSEVLFVLLSTATMVSWVRATTDDVSERLSVLRYALVGLLTGISILTRPTALYLPVALIIIEVILRLVRNDRQRSLAPLTLMVVAYVVAIPWAVRNQMVFGVPRLTAIDSLILFYYVAAGAYQVQFGIDKFEIAQTRSRPTMAWSSLIKHTTIGSPMSLLRRWMRSGEVRLGKFSPGIRCPS